MIKLLVLIGASFLQPQAEKDSIGVETINGKVFVIHKVGEKETLYALSKRYGTTVDAIVKQNPTASSGLEIGQILKVPYTAPVKPKQQTSGGIIHVVAAGETMFSISKAYNVSVDDVKQWNSLTSNSLSVGQELVIKRKNTATTQTSSTPTESVPSAASRKGVHTVAQKETMFSIARQYGVTVDQLKTWNNLQGTELSIGQALFVSQPAKGTTTPVRDNPSTTTVKVDPPATTSTPTTVTTPREHTPATTSQSSQTTTSTPSSTQTIRISEATKNSDEVLETGLAELIEGTEGNRKYLALHSTAPVGTILKIRNEMNNREVFVRVMGKLPDSAKADKVVIRISRSAYDRLGAIDPKFRVQVTYYK
jgi:LysM repeat protein